MKDFYDSRSHSARIVAILALCSLGFLKTAAQEQRANYIPFVEEGKKWYCDYFNSSKPLKDPLDYGIDCIFTMTGDTLIAEKMYKKVYLLFGEYYGDNEQHYYCAVREESCRVFVVENEVKDEKMIYDFSHPDEVIKFIFNERQLTRGHAVDDDNPWLLSGQLQYYLFDHYEDGQKNIVGYWIDGVGNYIGNPFALEFYPGNVQLGKWIRVTACMKDKILYYTWDWMSVPVEPTAIGSEPLANSEVNDEHIYDLQGRRLTTEPKRGVYIKGGKLRVKSGM